MITKLTTEQEAAIPEFEQKWIDIVTQKIDKANCTKYINQMWSQMGHKEPEIIFGSSPMNTINLNAEMVNSSPADISWYLCFYFLMWGGLYDFAKFVGVEFDTEKYNLFINFIKEVHFIIPYEGVCFVSEKPIHVRWQDRKLHNDGGLAVEYADGYGMYCLNGIRMPSEIVLTPAHLLDPSLVLKEKNAEVRREIIRKIGVENVIEKLGAKTVDTKGDEYELLNFDCIDGRYRPYLKMKNPSSGVWHVEGVHPDCKTVEQALNFRNPFIKSIHEKYIRPEILT